VKKAYGGLAPTILEYLRQDPASGGLVPAAERLVQLQQDLNLLLPETSFAQCRIHLTGEGVLLVRVRSAALAGKLRQTVPRIQAGLVNRGWKVNAIQVRVQPDLMPLESDTYKNRPKAMQIPSTALTSWSGLVDELEESPLRDAIRRLVRRHGGSAKGV